MFIKIKRSIKLALINLLGNVGLSLVAIFSIAISLLFLNFVFVSGNFAENIASEIKDRIGVSVYFKEGVDENIVIDFKEEVLALDDVTAVQYVSKQEALEMFILKNKDNPVLMAALAEVGNPFLSYISIISDTPEGYRAIDSFVNQSPSSIFFYKIDSGEKMPVINEIFQITSIFKKIGIILAISMSFIGILIIFNITRLSIYEMKEEINIMSLVGASRGFLISTFVFQGFIIGAIGFLFSSFMIFLFSFAFSSRIALLIPNLNILEYFKNNFLFLFLIQFILAIILGIFSSLLAIRKNLKI
jgi:cell division transport system permease protein